MGKGKLAALLLTAVLLFLAEPLYVDSMYKATVTADAPAGTETAVSYRPAAGAPMREIPFTVKEGGHASIRIFSNGINELAFTESAKIRSVHISGKGTLNLNVTDGESLKNLSLKPKIRFDIKVFLLLAFFLLCSIYTVTGRKSVFGDKTPAIKNVEFLRLVFTVGVVCEHTCGALKLYSAGWLGVEFFFILSGFFLTLTFNPAKTVAGFVKSKFAHFAPLTLFCAIGKLKLIPLLQSLLFMQVWITPAMPEQSWYLGVLFWVGLFYFCMMKTFPEKYNDIIFGVLTFAAYSWMNKYGWARLPRGIAGIGLGYFVARVFRIESAKNAPDGRPNPLYSLAEAGVLFYSAGTVFVKALYPENTITAIAAFAALILLFVLRRGCVSRFFEKPVFAKIAACSFAIYMTHMLVVHDMVENWRAKYPAVAAADPATTAFLTVLYSCVFGWAVWRYVEIPASTWLKNKLR